MIKSSCSENKFKIANLKNLVYIYLKMHFNITILLCMLFLSIKYMHSIDNEVYAFLDGMHMALYWVRCYNGLCKKFNNRVCAVIIGAALLPGNTVYICIYLRIKFIAYGNFGMFCSSHWKSID